MYEIAANILGSIILFVMDRFRGEPMPRNHQTKNGATAMGLCIICVGGMIWWLHGSDWDISALLDWPVVLLFEIPFVASLFVGIIGLRKGLK